MSATGALDATGVPVSPNALSNISRGRALAMLGLLCLINALSYVDRSMLALVMPQMTRELQLSDTISGLVAGLPFALCYAACAIPAAWIADNRNRRNLLACALAVWSVVTILTGLVQNGWQLALARFGLGAGESAGHPTTASLIGDGFDVKTRTAAFAALSSSAYLGPLVGFPVVGWLLTEHGWRTAYWTAGVAGLVAALLFVLVVREPPRGRPLGEGSSVAFLPRVRRLLATRSYGWIVFAGGFNAINQGAHLTWGPTFLERVHHLDPQQVGLYFGTLRGVAGLAGAVVAAAGIGALVARDLRWQIRFGVLVAALPFLTDALFLFGLEPGLWRLGLGLSAFVTAIAIAMSYPLYVNAAPADLRATASAFYFLVASLMGFILGPFAVGVVSDALAPTMGGESLSVAMLAASSAALLSCICLLFASRTWLADVQSAEAA